MTTEEIEIFKEKIAETILPSTLNMTNEQIISIITKVEQENPDLPEGFGSMLLEQIIILKNKYLLDSSQN